MTFDGSKEQTLTGTDFMKKIRKYDINYHISEPERPGQNPAEGVIRKLRRKWFQIMVQKRVPRRLWDYGYCHACKVMQHTSSHLGRLNSRTTVEFVTGYITDISELLDSAFYDQCWYKENAGLGETHIGKWLGISHRIVPLISYWILTAQGTVISRTTVQRITHLETQTADNKERFRLFDLSIHEFFKDEIIVTAGAKPNTDSWAVNIQYDIRGLMWCETPSHLPMWVSPMPEFSLYQH